MSWFVLYIATIFAANWSLSTFGLIPVGFGLMAPAGVLFAGLALTLRDLTQDSLGKVAALLAIVLGALLSAIVSPQFALASGAAFLLSELADFVVYTPIRRTRPLLAVAASNTVGLVVDSALFLWLAFGSLAYLEGQIVGKLEVTILAVLALWAWRRSKVRYASA